MFPNIFGDENLTTTAVTIAIVVPAYNVLAVILLEFFRGGKPNAGQIIRGIFTNPLILGAIAGALTIVFTYRAAGLSGKHDLVDGRGRYADGSAGAGRVAEQEEPFAFMAKI